MSKKTQRRSWKTLATSAMNQLAGLTLYQKMTLIISFVGALSLIFIFLQTLFIYDQSRLDYEQSRLDTHNGLAATYGRIAEQTFAIDRLFMEKPELRPYFYDGVDIEEGHKDYDLVMSAAEYELDVFDAIESQLDYLPDGDDKDKAEDRETWRNYFADSFSSSPALCDRMKRNRNWYMARLQKVADENCK